MVARLEAVVTARTTERLSGMVRGFAMVMQLWRGGRGRGGVAGSWVVRVVWGWMRWAKARRRRPRTSLFLLRASFGATTLLPKASG